MTPAEVEAKLRRLAENSEQDARGLQQGTQFYHEFMGERDAFREAADLVRKHLVKEEG